jgi:hypothetical protein
MQAYDSPSARSQASTSTRAREQAPRRYRLIDDHCQPHRQLDGFYGSVDEAIADAIAWLGPLDDGSHHASLIGVDVSTSSGDWRTCRLPGPLVSSRQGGWVR